MSILLVDDRTENLLSLEAILANLGQNLVSVTSGREALRRLLDQEFAVVLLDVNLPEIDGFETASIIRERDKSRHTPIIFLTAYDRTDMNVSKAYSLGAVDFIFKPFDPEILRAKVNVFIELSRKTQQIQRLNATLERRVRQRTQELETANTILINQIAERRRAEAEVRRLNAHLEQLVRERTAELEAAYRELESFSYSVSHDLRAPVRRIDQFADILLHEHADNLNPEGTELLSRIGVASRQMGFLIDDLLKLARVTRNEMTIEKVDLSAMARGISAELRGTHPDWTGEMEIQPDLVVQGDARLLQVALQNLLDNALKFTSRTQQPHVAFTAKEEDGEIVYTVSDNGAGFDESHQDRLFQPFQRLHTSSEFPGTGIGLAIVERVITRHGGRIWASGKEGNGARFMFTLPEHEAMGSDNSEAA